MDSKVEEARKFALAHRSRLIDRLGQFVRFASISTDPAHRKDMQAAASWVSAYLGELGFENIQIFPPESHPVVYAEYMQAGPRAPTVLVYGHYDVQPADPIDQWHQDPFHAVVRGENLYGRGATDMKGQVLAAIYALEAILKTGELDVNVKLLIEGEEEIGSGNLGAFLRENSELLSCDVCLNPDAGMLAPQVPTITYALRGLAYFELKVFGPQQDLHSGVYGGIVHNPGQALCELIAGMHDPQGRITLPGFYDRVRSLDSEERTELARLPGYDESLIDRLGIPAIWGEPEYTPVERIGARPTLEINGLYSGFIGQGAKTVLPAYAMAKISCRLVPDQDPAEVGAQLRSYLTEHAPATIRWEVEDIVQGAAAISDPNSRWVQAMAQALQEVWGTPPVYKREGGSVPVLGFLQDILGVDSINIGFALPDDNMHGPNEKLHLPTLYKGVDSLIHFFSNLGKT